jgi:DNA-binding response OmpR family regulator
VNVLIAHGSEDSRRKLAQTIAGEGMGLLEAGDAAAALEVLVADEAPRLALIDWDLPGCDGPEICRLVRAYRDVGLPYMILLARSDRRLAEGLEAGADDCIRTPAYADELRARIKVGRRFAELPWERVAEAELAEQRPSSGHDGERVFELEAQRSANGDDLDDDASAGVKSELESMLVAP